MFYIPFVVTLGIALRAETMVGMVLFKDNVKFAPI